MESKEIIAELKNRWGVSTDTALAERLGTSKQVINRFKNKKTIDIQAKIIKLLLEELE
jgi:ribosome-binding protein aMBF1 (putative translation factor)